ncbi:MAG: bacteriohemerythrin [Colwellia sp.]
MKRIHSATHPDVIMIYQEKDSVELAIQQILELNLSFKAYKFNRKKLHDIAKMKPKVLLLSSNDIKNTIRLYIDYLEEYGQNIAPHSAILLINNREMACAYLACENGLFDNYAIINPLNEPFRLKLVLLQELKIIESHKNDSLHQLIAEGDEELASCIEHGVALKKSFLHEIGQCEEKLLSATDKIIECDSAKEVLQNLIGVSLEEMNENITAGIQGIIEQLATLKANNQSIKQSIEKQQLPNQKTTVGVNTELLTSDDSNAAEQHKTSSYKILIAEPSDLFSRVIEEIFAETVFKYLLVNNGTEALKQLSTFNPDIVLLAYDLPQISGLEITRIIREEGNKIPVIAYTHRRDKEVIKQWIPLGLSDYLIKPSKKSAILKSVDKAVKNPIEIMNLQSNENGNTIQWIPAYSIGNKDIDDQHKMLFAMMNEFFQQEGKDAAIVLFQNLALYIDLHFEAEENLLRQINYPKTDEHIKIHRELSVKFKQIQVKLNNYDIDIQHKIAIFLYKWLAKHILKSDMEYKSYALSIEDPTFNKADGFDFVI